MIALLSSAVSSVPAQPAASRPASRPTSRPAEPALVTRIAFGSCARQDQPQPIWDAVLAQRPDLFLFIGDNIYGDTEDMDLLRSKYAQLGAVPGFQRLRAVCRVLAVWDDHDLGENDAGAEYPKRAESQAIFSDFFGDSPDAPRRSRPGVYDAHVYGPPGRRVQVILLDSRSFRSPLKRRADQAVPGDGRPGTYVGNTDPDATMLGDAQWKWLEEQLRIPADMRIIASSIQVAAEDHGYEKWMNFPAERQRLLKLVRDTGAAGVVFVSGDRHTAELSCITGADAAYPLYDVTSSSLNRPSKWSHEINRWRIGTPYPETNFGLISIDWDQPDARITLEIRREKGEPAVRQEVSLSALQAGDETGRDHRP